jgi:hypothetical protein
MSELFKIVLTSGLTVVGGLAVFVLQRFVLEPLNEQSKVLGRITYAMFYWGREYDFPIDPSHAPEDAQKRYWAAADQIRGLAGSLAEASQSIRFRWIWIPLRLTPRRKKINDAIGLLTRMSNSFFAFNLEQRREQSRQNCADADEILKLLGMERWGKY